VAGLTDIRVFGRLLGRDHDWAADFLEQLGAIYDGVIGAQGVDQGLGERGMGAAAIGTGSGLPETSATRAHFWAMRPQ
jgi:hypothetical protein